MQQQAAPRILSPTEKHRISTYLAGKSTESFVIKASTIASDARAYADQMADLFRTASWTVRVDNAMFTGTNITGLWIVVKNGNAPPSAAGILQQGFAVAGINVRGQSDPTMPDEVWLCIGAK